MSDTPRTDALWNSYVIAEEINLDGLFAVVKQLERELAEATKQQRALEMEIGCLLEQRDEAREKLERATRCADEQLRYNDLLHKEVDKVMNQRDEALARLGEWENAARHVEAQHPNEAHCGCVPVLRKLLDEARHQRDAAAARAAHAENALEAATTKPS